MSNQKVRNLSKAWKPRQSQYSQGVMAKEADSPKPGWVEKAERLIGSRKNADVERDAGWTTNSLTNALNRGSVPLSDRGAALANVLGVSANWLFDDTRPWPPESPPKAGEGEKPVHSDEWELAEVFERFLRKYEMISAIPQNRIVSGGLLLVSSHHPDTARRFIALAAQIERGAITFEDASSEGARLIGRELLDNSPMTPERAAAEKELWEIYERIEAEKRSQPKPGSQEPPKSA